MDVMLGTDIHSHGRPVENHDVQVAGEPFGQDYLLLVSAGKGQAGVFWIRCCDRKFLHPAVYLFLTLWEVHRLETCAELVDFRNHDVVRNALREEQAFAETVFWNESDLAAYCIPGSLELHRIAVDKQLAS